MNIAQMCTDAQNRVIHHINRSAGQHSRALRRPSSAATEQARITSDALYCLGCALTDAGIENDTLIESMCKFSGVSFPPEQMERTS